jgi:hypothetical protein
MTNLLAHLRWRKYAVPAIAVVLFAIAGAVLLFVSKAAMPYTSIEAESGTISGSASIASNSNASSGSYIQFGSQSAGSTGPYTVVIDDVRPEADLESSYATVAGNHNVIPALRANVMNINDTAITTWQSKSLNYYYTVASSDFVTGGESLYATQSDGTTVLGRSHDLGLYMHEVVADIASTNGWNWPAAASNVDWSLINSWVTAARADNKKVIWSEPANGWQAIEDDPTGSSYLAQWGNTLVPMFATNFTTPANLVPTARTGAETAAATYHLALGESVQSWYWVDKNVSFTSSDVIMLCQYGYTAGASYYQIEGDANNMAPSSTYMTGVDSFVAGLGSSVPPLANNFSDPLP